MASSSKRQTTFAKMQREQRIKERRALKQEKKQAAREAKAAAAVEPVEVDETLDDTVAAEPAETRPETIA